MAKLEGVKVVDMQDGEITKITYEGAEYTKVENVVEPIDGDIALNKRGTKSYTEGGYYELRKGLTKYGSFGTKTDDQGSTSNGKSGSDFDVFRKVSDPSTGERLDDLETRVSTLENGLPAAGYDKPAKVGDTIFITDAYGTSGKYSNGDKLTVTEVDDEGDVVLVEEFDGYKYIAEDEYVIIGRKEMAEKETEESLVGKYVVFSYTDGVDLTVGKAYEINSEDGYGYFKVVDDVGDVQWVSKDENVSRFDYETHNEKPADKPSFEVGDTVKLTIPEGETPKYSWGSVRNGDVGTVVVSESNENIRVDFPEQSYWRASSEELTLLPKSSLKKGDYAKVVGSTYYGDIKRGSFVVIDRGIDVEGDHRIELIDGTKFDHTKPEFLEKVELSDVDLAFLKAGREPNEYKDGDIVRVVDSSGSALTDGDIGIVTQVSVKFRVKTVRHSLGNWRKPEHVEPIAFVESRVDIDA